jgi:hypothetical protein
MASLNCRSVRCEKAPRVWTPRPGVATGLVTRGSARRHDARGLDGRPPRRVVAHSGERCSLAPRRPVAWLTRAIGIARRAARLVVRTGRLGLSTWRAGGLIAAPSIPCRAPAVLGSAAPETELAERCAVQATGFTNTRASLEVAHRALRVWPHPAVDRARIESLGLQSPLGSPDVACRDQAMTARHLDILILARGWHVLIATWGPRVIMRGLDHPGARTPGDWWSHGRAEAA